MIYTTSKPSEIGIYIQPGLSGWKSAYMIRRQLEADSVINAQMWNMSNGVTSYALKVHGIIHGHDEGAWIWGYGWNDGETELHWGSADHMNKWDNYLGCEKLVINGKLECHDSAVKVYGGKRGRTALGLKENGQIVMLVTNDSNPISLDDLGKQMISVGCVNAIMLDGGASSQIDSVKGVVTGRRYVQSLFWTKEETIEDRVKALENEVFRKSKN